MEEVDPMHPTLMSTVVDTRVRELREAAVEARTVRAAGGTRPVRRRTGWWLVEVGLRLALGPAGPAYARSHPLPAGR
jgi:hypothetical protein